jgi:hypothetical protein
MSAIVPFESAKLPAFLRNRTAPIVNELSANVGGGGFPVLSIKGKVFTLVKGKEREVLLNPEDTDEVATSISVVLLKANAGLSKVWYANGYVEGAVDAPDCFSHDGIVPDPSAEHKQSTKCQGCPKAVWGSKISDAGKKLKACSDSRRVAIANLDDIENPILLRIPAATLAPLAAYGDLLAARNAPYNSVVTKIGFDRDSASPKLTFKPLGWLTDEQWTQVEEVVESDAVAKILGVTGEAPIPHEDDLPEGAPPKAAVKAAPAPAPKPAAKPAPKPAPKEYDNGGGEDDGEPAPAPVKAAPKPAPKAAPKPVVVDANDSLEDDLDALLGGMDD